MSPVGLDFMDDTAATHRGGTVSGAGAATGRHAGAGRARPRGDGAAVRRGLETAPDCCAPGILPRDGADGLEALPRRGYGEPPPRAARTTARRGPAPAGGSRAGRVIGPRSHLDGRAARHGAQCGVRHHAQHPPDAQVSDAHGRALAARGAHPRPQARSGAGGAGDGGHGCAQKKAAAGHIRLVYLDECGFAPSQPVTSTWVRQGERKRMPYENPEGRRINALAGLSSQGSDHALYWVSKLGSYTADHLIRFLHALPAADVPTVVVLDNAGIHRSHVVRDARPALRALGLHLYYLPPYSPHLNAIEPVFRVIKHHELPERRYTSLTALRDAVTAAFTSYEEALIRKHHIHPGQAA
jgi:transposase